MQKTIHCLVYMFASLCSVWFCLPGCLSSAFSLVHCEMHDVLCSVQCLCSVRYLCSVCSVNLSCPCTSSQYVRTGFRQCQYVKPCCLALHCTAYCWPLLISISLLLIDLYCSELFLTASPCFRTAVIQQFNNCWTMQFTGYII